MTMWPKGLLLVALLGSALADGIPDDVEVVTSTSVSVRVSTSEDHVPRESIINQIVDKDEEKSDQSTKKDITIKDEQKTSSQGQTITVKATTESPKYRLRQKGTSPATTVTAAETTTTTTPAPSTEPPKEPPRRKRKRPAGYRRPEGLPVRKRPDEERRQSPARPHPAFAHAGVPPQQGLPLPALPHPALPQHVELNRHHSQPTARPQYQSPPPRVLEPLPPLPAAPKEAPVLKRLPVPPPAPEKTEAVHHPQVRPRPVVFEPQLHQPLPLPVPQAHQNQRPVPSVASVPLPSTVSQLPQQDGSTSAAPEQPSTKKPLKLKKHRAPDAQKRPQQTQITLPPPTKSKVATTTAKSSFLSYFSFGKKDEKASEGVSTPLPPVSLPVPAPIPVQAQQPHHGSVHRAVAPQVRPHYQAEPFQPGPVELSFRESVKQQKFPKTTKSHKPQKTTKKHFRDDYPIPPVVPIPPPRYDEPYRPLESSQPQKTTQTHTSYTAPPPTPSEPVQTTYSAPVETQKPHHHPPNYTPPPSSQPQFIFGYPQDQAYQPPYQQAQPQSQQYSQPIYSQPSPQQYHTYQTTYQGPQASHGAPHHDHGYQQQQQQQQTQQTYHVEPQGRPQGPYQQSESQGYQQDSPQSFQQSQHQHGFQQQQQQQQQAQPQHGFQQHQQHSQHQQTYDQPQALLVQVPSSVNPGHTQIELPAEMLKALGVKNVAPGVAGSADVSHNQASVVSHLSNGQGVVVLDELSNRPYVRPNSEVTYHHQGYHGDPVPVDVSKTPYTKGLPHGFPAPSKIQVDDKTQVSLSGVVLPHHGLKTSYNELPPTQVNLNEPLNVHIPISQLPPRPAVNVRIKGPNGKVSEVLVPLHESNIKRFPHVGGYPNLAEKPKKYLPPFYGGSSHGKHIQHSFVDQQEFGAHSTQYIRYAQPVQETLQTAASTPQASWIGGWGTSIRNMGSRIGSIFSRKASSS